MYKIKQSPEDFRVEEVIDLDFDKKGDYSYYLIEKKNWNTKDVVKIIAKRLRIRERRINIAGIKDKNAVARQYISIFNINPNNAKGIRINNVKIRFIGFREGRIRLGQIKENKFKIVVRNLDSESRKINFIENYFDEQRFGGRNHLLGRALVKKEFRKLCYMLRLKWEKGDYIGAIRKLKKSLLIFYINSYQSFLWNKAVEKYVESKCKNCFYSDYSAGRFAFCDDIKNIKIPLIGFGTEFNNEEIKGIYEKILEEEKVSFEDFVFREIPELTSEGTERNLKVNVRNLKIKYETDERNKEKKKALLRFSLPSGSYGTVVVRKMFS